MRLVLLGQPGDKVIEWARQLAHAYEAVQRLQPHPWPPLELSPCESRDQTPDWSTLQAHDLVLLLEGPEASTVDWRTILTSVNQGFQVIYPSPQPPVQALQWALGHHLQRTLGDSPWPLRAEIASRWQGLCEKCSDPECEHQMFRRLVAARSASSSSS